RRALSHHGKMDARILHILGLHRLRPVHAHLVCKPPGGDRVFPYAKHAILVGVEHAAGDWALFRTVCDFAFTLDQEASAPALLDGRMEGLHADARHVSRRFAGITWYRRAR